MTHADFLLDRARAFAPTPTMVGVFGARLTLHHAAIATELALKASLARCGADDDWLARRIGHDLFRAVSLADRLGLNAGDDVRRLVTQLDPHFRNGGFQHLPDFWMPGFEREAPAIVDALITLVASRL